MNIKSIPAFVALALVIFLPTCTDSNESEDSSPNKVKQVSQRFKDFLHEFQPLASRMILNTTCLDVTQNRNFKYLNSETYRAFLNGYKGPAVSIGFFRDTSQYYSVIYCTAAACYLPNLAVYDHSGKLRQTMLIASGCGAGMGYECKETVTIQGGNQLITLKNERYYECDSLGQKLRASEEEKTTKIKYSVKDGAIQVDTLRK